MAKIHNKLAIVEVATSMFRDYGFHGTPVRLIAKELGVSVSTIYGYFDSKQAILAHICFDVGKKFLDSMDRERLEKTDVDPREKLKNFIKNHVLIMGNNTKSIDVYTKEWKYMKAPDVGAFKKQMKQYKRGLSEILIEGIEKGAFVNLNVRLSASFILSSINNFEQLKLCPISSLNAISSNLSAIMVRGMSKQIYRC